MPELVWLVPIALAVGWLIGAVGIGGVLLIPALTAVAGLEVHVAIATALFSFLFTGIAGTLLFQRLGSIDWASAAPVCIAALLCSFAGAWASARTDARLLIAVLALIMIAAGLHAAFGRYCARTAARHGCRSSALLASIGAVSGFGSGLTGVGGPALSVPLMMLAGFSPLAAVGNGQVLQIVAALSGSAANLKYGAIDFRLALLITALQVSGLLFGARFAHGASTPVLKRLVATLCVTVGALLLFRTLVVL